MITWEGNCVLEDGSQRCMVAAICDCCEDYVRVQAREINESDSAFIDLKHRGWALEFVTKTCLCPKCAEVFPNTSGFFRPVNRAGVMRRRAKKEREEKKVDWKDSEEEGKEMETKERKHSRVAKG